MSVGATVHGPTGPRSPGGALPRPPRRPGWESNGRQQTTFRSPVPGRGWLHGGDGAKGGQQWPWRKEEREKKARVSCLDLPSCVAPACTRRTPMDPACPLASLGLGSRFQCAPVVRSLFLPAAELGRRGSHVACRRRSFPFLCLLPTPGAIASIHSFPPTRATHPRHPDTLPCSCSSVAVILEALVPQALTPSFPSRSFFSCFLPAQLRLLLFSCSLALSLRSLPQFRPRDCTVLWCLSLTPNERPSTRQHHHRPLGRRLLLQRLSPDPSVTTRPTLAAWPPSRLPQLPTRPILPPPS